MKRLLLVVALVSGLVVVAPSAAVACSCVMRGLAEQAQAADTVVAATLEWSSVSGTTRSYGIAVDEVYKGAAAEREKLTTEASDASCGLGRLDADKRYLFFIDGRHPGTMQVTLCGGTTEFTDQDAAVVEQATGAPEKPLASAAGPTQRIDSDEPARAAWTGWAIGGGTAALVLGLAAWGRRRLRRTPGETDARSR